MPEHRPGGFEAVLLADARCCDDGRYRFWTGFCRHMLVPLAQQAIQHCKLSGLAWAAWRMGVLRWISKPSEGDGARTRNLRIDNPML